MRWRSLQKKTIKWIIVLVCSVAVIGGGYAYYQQQSKQAASVAITNTTQVTRGNAKAIVSATGTIKPLESVEISSKITARIKQIPVKENDIVKAGQTLVVLEDKELDTKLDQAKYKVTNSKGKYERISYLHSLGAKSDQD